MQLLSFHDGKRSGFGFLKDDGIVDLSNRMGLNSLKAALSRPERIQQFSSERADYSLLEVSLLPPIPDPAKILCVGLNYMSHLQETGRERPKYPIIFSRYADTQVGHGQPMIRPRVSKKFDFEGELAVVIGQSCRNVAKSDAASVIAGYSCYNDGSVRDWQMHSSQFGPGKNFPSSGSFGPWIVTKDHVPSPEQCTLTTRLNGREMQRAQVSDLVFDIPDLIQYCSTFTHLAPGDVIVTGTTGGVGGFRKPPIWMKAGDVIEVEITGIGTLSNPIIDEES